MPEVFTKHSLLFYFFSKPIKQTESKKIHGLRVLLVLGVFCFYYILVVTVITSNQKKQENNTSYVLGIAPYHLDLSLNKKLFL